MRECSVCMHEGSASVKIVCAHSVYGVDRREQLVLIAFSQNFDSLLITCDWGAQQEL